MRADVKMKDELVTYRALGNDTRLKVLLGVADAKLSFNDLARKLRIERGLLAYHVAVLKSAGLIENSIEKRHRGRKFSLYSITSRAFDLMQKLGIR